MTEPTQPQDETTTAAAAEDVQNPDAVARAQATPGEEYEVTALADDAAEPQEPTA